MMWHRIFLLTRAKSDLCQDKSDSQDSSNSSFFMVFLSLIQDWKSASKTDDWKAGHATGCFTRVRWQHL